jgi:predicted nucleotidyltransferase
MLSHEDIQNAVTSIAPSFPIKTVAYFGSYAVGKQTDVSDLDVLVEFTTSAVSLITIADIKNQMEDALGIPVDVIHYPLPENAYIELGKVVSVYGR